MCGCVSTTTSYKWLRTIGLGPRQRKGGHRCRRAQGPLAARTQSRPEKDGAGGLIVKRRLVSLLLLVAVTSLVPAVPADAGHCFRDNFSRCVHWTRRTSLTFATVYFLDHTPSRWPVKAVTSKWNESTQLDTFWRWYTNGCPLTPAGTSHHCVHVQEYNNANDARAGFTNWFADPNAHMIPGTVEVWLNAARSGSSNQNRHVTCQELGHAVALDHQDRAWAGPPNNWGLSCMMNPATGDALYPNGHDYHTLWADMYNH